MDIPVGTKDQLPVQDAIEQDITAAIETAKAVKPDAGLRSLDHYKIKLPPWRYATRQTLIPLIRWETPYVAKLQKAMRSPFLDSYFSLTANLGTHTFFMVFLPILFWCGHTDLGRVLVHVLAFGVVFSGFIKDWLCLPRPLSPPLRRISMSPSVSLEYGFPSTHSTNAVSVVVYAVFLLRSDSSDIDPVLKTALEIASYLYATSIVLGRLYCGMHGFLDVAIGSILGALLSIMQWVYGGNFDDFMFQGSATAPLLFILVILVLVRIHPEPADDCPCFDDSVAFAGVMIGVESGNWHYARSGYAWDLPVPATVPFDLITLGWLKTVARIVVGVVVIIAWREVMKPALLRHLPPLFRIVESLGLSLPRRFFIQASMYSSVPKNLKTDSVLPPISEIPALITSLRNPRKHRSVSVGPQSEADAYEALAFHDRQRRETTSDDFPRSPRMTAVPTLAPAQSKLQNGLRFPDVFPDDNDGPDALAKCVSTPERRPSEDGREYEKERQDIFSMVEKPRVRYDVEVITKLVVYTGMQRTRRRLDVSPHWLFNNSFDRFMQPEPTEVTQKTFHTSASDNQHTNQYGYHDHHAPAASHLHGGDRAAGHDPTSTPGIGAPDSASAHDSVQDLHERQRRVSSTSSKSSRRTGSPVDRIIEHEQAVITLPKRKHEGPAFTVTRPKSPGNPRLSLTDFPNEVLTHILSHLPPSTLSEVSSVSRRFHSLVTSPHAWRIAFSRHFPAQEALTEFDQGEEAPEKDTDTLRSERRVFTRLTALASWRSEYILRTRLIRSLGRGKPASIQETVGAASPRSSSGSTANAQITYNSNLVTTVNHLDATFTTSLKKRLPNFIHGADEVGSACLSDSRTGKIDNWGFADPQMFAQFLDAMPGVSQYGLGPGEIVGVPNAMDVSRLHGMVYAEGIPSGKMYYRSTEEKRGRLLSEAVPSSWPQLGVPQFAIGTNDSQTPCALWIAKSAKVPACSGGLVGILLGSSQGVVTAYSVGTNGLDERRIERGEVTCRWVLSPGVPIIGFAVDENVSTKRLASGRAWAVALNALGELYYLSTMPSRPHIERKEKMSHTRLELLAWETGRTVHWDMAEPSRRVVRPDPFDGADIDSSYSPRSSWNGMGLSPEQIAGETKEIQRFLAKKPMHFRKTNEGWDMRRKIEVDFAGDDGMGAGENFVVIECGLDEGDTTSIRRYTRCKVANPAVTDPQHEMSSPIPSNWPKPDDNRLFGTGQQEEPTWSFDAMRRNSIAQSESVEGEAMVEEWRVSNFSFGGLKAPQITAAALDLSTYAFLTVNEDPLLAAGGSSLTSSPTSSPLPQMARPGAPSDVPGQRSRLLAVGTKSGTIILWNLRDPASTISAIESTVKPVRIIHTESPQISCLALSALYLVHGGNDGLVQAWDPLASTLEPIRTLNSRFSSRARRRLVQAEASPQGVGINLFAAGAIFLDPDPTVLRGMVSLGTHLRYWSYSSLAADQYKSNKRRLRRSERGSNQGADRFTGTGRGALKDYIANEKFELEKEKISRHKEEERLAGRFGLDLLGPGATEDEILAYATLLSEEAAASDEQRRRSGSEGSSGHETILENPASPERLAADDDMDQNNTDPDIAEAIRLSLQQTTMGGGEASFPIKIRKGRRAPSSSPPRKSGASSSVVVSSKEQDELEYALQLSLAEDRSRDTTFDGKGKGKGRGS
ncbi:MAG: hypothetical protein Q9168_005954 [Polycauliona sp. 1 TL-2023]